MAFVTVGAKLSSNSKCHCIRGCNMIVAGCQSILMAFVLISPVASLFLAPPWLASMMVRPAALDEFCGGEVGSIMRLLLQAGAGRGDRGGTEGGACMLIVSMVVHGVRRRCL